MGLDIDDLRLDRGVAEVRYDNAYYLFDRTGVICEAARRKYPDLSMLEATPAKTAFQVGDITFVMELNQSRLVSAKPQKDLEEFSAASAWYFKLLADQLEITKFNRIAIRLIHRKIFKSMDEAAQAVLDSKLLNVQSGPVFGIQANFKQAEFMVRVDSEKFAAAIWVKSETQNVSFDPPPDARDFIKPVKRENHAFVYDVDYYSVVPVEVGQIAFDQWIKQCLHLVRRDSREFLR